MICASDVWLQSVRVMAKVQYETKDADHENNVIIMSTLSETFTYVYSNSPAMTNCVCFICCFCELKVSVLWIGYDVKSCPQTCLFGHIFLLITTMACDWKTLILLTFSATAPKRLRHTHWSPHTDIMLHSISFIMSEWYVLFNLHAISNIRCFT